MLFIPSFVCPVCLVLPLAFSLAFTYLSVYYMFSLVLCHLLYCFVFLSCVFPLLLGCCNKLISLTGD